MFFSCFLLMKNCVLEECVTVVFDSKKKGLCHHTPCVGTSVS